jgi:glutamyl-tRNA reductase
MSLADFLAAAEAGSQQWDGVLFAVHSKAPFFHARHCRGIKILVDVSLPSVIDASGRDIDGLQVLDLDAVAGLVEAEGESRRSRLRVATDLVKARARALDQCLQDVGTGANANLARIVEQHVETALHELDTVFRTKLSHLSSTDQDSVRQAVLRSAKRNAHLHLKDVRELSRS